MKITWLGHASFIIEDSKGRKLLTDPFDKTVGYETYKGTADVVTISHEHFDHNYTKDIQGNFELVNKVGFFYACDIPVKGIPSYHDKSKGAKRGDNIIYTFKMDDYVICHLGDLGHALTKEDIEAIGKVNILLIPVGGNFTLDGKEAAEVAKAIDSNIVIPMHYKTPELSFPLDGVENFIMYMKNGDKIENNSLEITAELTEHNIVKILNYK